MIRIHSSYAAAAILARAFERFGVSPQACEISTPCRQTAPAPELLLLQPGGLVALREIGIDIERLARRGNPVLGLQFCDRSGVSRWSIRHDIVGDPDLPPALAIATHDLMRELGEGRPLPSRDLPERRWLAQSRRTGIAMEICDGNLDLDGLGLVWDSGDFHLGVVDVGAGRLMRYAVAAGDGAAGREAAEASFTRAADVLASALRFGKVHRSHWFPERQTGVCSAAAGGVLLWGSLAADLHPLTGQSLSYWAGEAVWLAKQLARRDACPDLAALCAESHSRNLSMYRRNAIITGYHLRHTWFWRLARAPYTLALSQVHQARIRAMKMLALV